MTWYYWPNSGHREGYMVFIYFERLQTRDSFIPQISKDFTSTSISKDQQRFHIDRKLWLLRGMITCYCYWNVVILLFQDLRSRKKKYIKPNTPSQPRKNPKYRPAHTRNRFVMSHVHATFAALSHTHSAALNSQYVARVMCLFAPIWRDAVFRVGELAASSTCMDCCGVLCLYFVSGIEARCAWWVVQQCTWRWEGVEQQQQLVLQFMHEQRAHCSPQGCTLFFGESTDSMCVWCAHFECTDVRVTYHMCVTCDVWTVQYGIFCLVELGCFDTVFGIYIISGILISGATAQLQLDNVCFDFYFQGQTQNACRIEICFADKLIN